MTMAHILDEGVPSLSFCLEGVEQVDPYEYIREFLGFLKGAPERVYVHEGTLEGWSVIAGGAHQQRNTSQNPIIQVFHSWMCKRIFGENERNKGNRHRVELALLGFDCQAANRPLSPHGSRCYLSMLAISLRPGITRNPEHLLARTSLGFEYMKQGKYVSGDERGGFKVAKVNLPLSDRRLRLFLEGKED
jgi:hypothetical protein